MFSEKSPQNTAPGGASRLLAAGGMDALLRLLDGACHAALQPLALSTLAGAAAAWMSARTGALQA